MDNQPQPDMNNYERTDQSSANTKYGLHNYDKTDQSPTYTQATQLSYERTDQSPARPTTNTEACIHNYAQTDQSTAWLSSYSLTDLNNSNQGSEDSFVDINENITEEDSLPGLLGSGEEHEDVAYPMFSTDTVEDSGLWSTLPADILEEDERDIHIDQQLTDICTDMASLRKQTTAVTVSNGERKSAVRSSEYSGAVQTPQGRYTAEGKENQSVTGHQSVSRSVSSGAETHHPGPSGDSTRPVLTDKKTVNKRHSAPPKASSSRSNNPGGVKTQGKGPSNETNNSFVSSVFTAFNEVSQKYHGPEFEKQTYINDGIATVETEDSFSEEIRYNRKSGQSVTTESAPRSPKVKHAKSEDLGPKGRPALVKAYHSVTCTPDDAPKVVTRSLVEQTENLKGINSEDLRKDLRKLTEPSVVLTSIKTFDPDQAFHYFAEAEHSDKTAKKLHHVEEPPKAHTEVFLAESKSHTHLEQQSPRPRHQGKTSLEQPNPKITRSLTEGTQDYSRGSETSKFSPRKDLHQSSSEVNVEKPVVVKPSANGVLVRESSKTDYSSGDQIIRESPQSPKQLSPVRKSSSKKRRAPPPPPQGLPYDGPPLKSPERKGSTSSNGKQADITSVSTVNKVPPVNTATGTSSNYSAERTSPGVHYSEPSPTLSTAHKKAAPPPPPVRLPKQPCQRQEVGTITEVGYGRTAQSAQRQSSQSNGIGVVQTAPAGQASQNKGQDKKQGHIQLNVSRDYSPTKSQPIGTQAESRNGDLVGAFTFCVNGKSDTAVSRNSSIDLKTSEDGGSSSPPVRNSLSEVPQGRRESTGAEVKVSKEKNQAPRPPPSPAHKSPTGRKKAPAPPPPTHKRVKLQDIRGKQKKYDETIEYPVQNTVTTAQLHELKKNQQETSVGSRRDSGPTSPKHSAEQNLKLKSKTRGKNKPKGKYTISQKEKAESNRVQKLAHDSIAIVKRIEVARTDTVVEVKHQLVGPNGDINGYGPAEKVKFDQTFGSAEQQSRMASKGKPRSRVIINLDSGEERDMTNKPQSRPNIKQDSDTQRYSKHAGKADDNSGIILISKKNVNHNQTMPVVKETDTYYVPEPAFEHSDDSDLSDVEGSFQATFNPSTGLVTTGETQVSDEEDSGITLVSYQKTAADDERPAQMPGKRKVKVPSSVSFAETTAIGTDFYGECFQHAIADVVTPGDGDMCLFANIEPPPLPASEPPPHPFTPPSELPMHDLNADHSWLMMDSNELSNSEVPLIPTAEIGPLPSGTDRLISCNVEPYGEAVDVSPGSNKVDMDPRTGLRRTSVSSSVEKAVMFTEKTEPTITFRKKKQTGEGSRESDTARSELLKELRVKRSSAPASLTLHDGEMAVKVTDKTELNSKTPSSQHGKHPSKITTRSTHPRGKPGTVDSRSISDQEKTKKLWEKQLLSPDAKLFPDLPDTVKKEHNYDHGEFVSTVDSDSIADLASTKKRWEIQAAKYEKEQGVKSPKQKQVTPVTSPVIEKNPAEVAYESAVDREVRLALERERRLREEKHKRFYGESKLLDETENKYRESHDMEVERHTHSSHIEKTTPASPPEADLYNRPSYNELTEADRASPQVHINTQHYSDQDVFEHEEGSQSIIEQEIREQAKLEEKYRKEKIYKEGQRKNKELEQSEYERQEKEAERISAHESIIDREIREQQQKEASLAQEHGWVYQPGKHVNTSGIEVDEPDNQYIPEPVAEPAVAYEPPPPVVQSPPPPAPQTHHRSRGSRTMNHSQEQNSFTNDSNRVQYEDSVITKRPSVGENRIARELREQREREMEVRRTRESAGLRSLSEDHEEVTPFLLSTGMDSSGTLPPEKRTPEAYRETSQVYTSPHPVESPAQMIETPPPAARPSSIGTFTSKPASGPSPQVTPQSSTPSRSLVMPFRDDDEEDEADNADFGKVETPIEREIRLAREREEEFRRAKGLPSPKPVSEKEVVVDVTDGTPVTRRAPVYRKGNEGDNKGTMKKYTSSKLRHEMDAEKMRENDLRKLGKVNTTSEDYVTETRKYQERVPEGPPVVPNYKKPPTPSSTPTSVKSPVEVKPSPQPSRGRQIQNGVRSPVPEATSPVVNNASPQSTSETYTFRRARNQAETRIERELREMKEREMELRKQRELVGQHNPELQEEDDVPVAPPRKSRGARASEWERMHSQTQ